MDLGGKVFVVGGASRGIGRAIAAELTSNGARAVMLSRTAEAVEAAAAAPGARPPPRARDIADPGTPGRIREPAGDRIDGIVVNSGGPPLGNALDVSDD